MGKFRNGVTRVLGFLGLRRNSAYVNAYIHKANIRSGLFMSAVVAILEVWLVIRQHTKYIVDEVSSGKYSYFDSLFRNTSLYWLLMVLGVSMFLYCLYYLSSKKNNKGLMIAVLVFSSIGVALCTLIPLENRIKNYNPKRLVDTILLISLYATILLYHILVVIATLTKNKGIKADWLQSVAVITIFATALLVFGIKVSYGDFTSIKNGAANPDYKQIICFLMMSIYVGCLLIWRPYISIAIVGSIFLGFYFLLKSFEITNPGIRQLPEGDVVNYITFFISLVMVSVSIYSQRHLEAEKDEELEILATKDKLTGLHAFEYFNKLVAEKIKDEEIKENEYIYLFMDIVSFKILNDQKGFDYGNRFLKHVGKILTEVLGKDALITRQGDDHFVVFAKSEGIEQEIEIIGEKVKELDLDVKPGVKVGGYLFRKKEEDTHNSIEKARYAFSILKEYGHQHYLLYDQEISKKYKLIQYVVSQIDDAVAEGRIQAYYQPVVFSKDRTLCGVEALSRWVDPKYGFLNPGTFIPALEDAQLAYKLDLEMLEIVCKNMRRVLDEGGVIVPTSINFSRADFSIVDIPNEVIRITSKYNIPTKYLHIEITESALLDEHVDLKDAMNRLKENGFSIWLDDFGSGYSSFNTLKDYSFDVLKLDQEFLKGFDTNQKSRPLIKAVIEMANQIKMRTLAEGVETEEQAEFLKSIGCEKLQGYLISKPVSYKDLNEGIKTGKFVIASDLGD